MGYASALVPTSSSSSFPSAAEPLKKYDVFISFRGEDTRAAFTSHLVDALRQNQIETYIDNRLEKGHEIWPELVKAIRDSEVFVVILSENYASSTWCLNELLEIMECKRKGTEVIPVFYKIEPSHVRKQTGSYHKAFTEYEQDSKRSNDEVREWKAALSEIANLSGFDASMYRTEVDLIEDIIKAILGRLNHEYSYELKGHYIADQNYADVESLLREHPVIGIWGMGGIGKTSLAAAIFKTFASEYEGCCFLGNVREELERHGLDYLSRRLLSELLREENLPSDTHNVISAFDLRRLRRKKVFIVLDDINSSQDLKKLVGEGFGWLGAGSRVIVTSRDKQVPISGDVSESGIHQVKEMNDEHSLQLFSWNAFKRASPKEGYEELSRKAIVYAKGIPLALKVLGSFRHSKSESEWHSALKKLKKIPNPDIQKVLRLSYDELDDTDKNILLDIACFLKGLDKMFVMRLLNAYGFYGNIGIRNLLNKALITTTSFDDIEMHDLIQQMGRDIVRQESVKYPERRSRLWDNEEIYHVLKNNKGTEAIEGILLNLSEIPDLDLYLSSDVFEKMPSLRFLKISGDMYGMPRKAGNVHLPKGLESLPNELRYLWWDEYPCKSLPSTFSPQNLVKLIMRDTKVRKLWNGAQDLPNLVSLDLGSACLEEVPDLSRAPKLKSIWLWDCGMLHDCHLSLEA